jgi:hypothetical protein
MGRPRSADVREERLVVLLRESEKQRLENAAENAGLSVSAYVRSLLLAAWAPAKFGETHPESSSR